MYQKTAVLQVDSYGSGNFLGASNHYFIGANNHFQRLSRGYRSLLLGAANQFSMGYKSLLLGASDHFEGLVITSRGYSSLLGATNHTCKADLRKALPLLPGPRGTEGDGTLF